jgi:hypothetical protein
MHKSFKILNFRRNFLYSNTFDAGQINLLNRRVTIIFLTFVEQDDINLKLERGICLLAAPFNCLSLSKNNIYIIDCF